MNFRGPSLRSGIDLRNGSHMGKIVIVSVENRLDGEENKLQKTD